MQPLRDHPPQHQQDEDGQQNEDGRQQVPQAEHVLLLFLVRLGQLPGCRARQAAGQLLGILPRGQCLEQLGHGLDALHRLQLQAQPEHLREVLRHRRLQCAGARVRIRHQPLRCRDRALPADHPVDHRSQTVFVGVAALKLGGRILFRGRVALVQLLVQAAARCAQANRSVARQPGTAIFQHPDVLRADAPMHQTHLVHRRHAVKHWLQHRADLLRRQPAGMCLQPAAQRHPAGIFHHGIDRVVLLEHIQHGFQSVGGRDALDGAVQVRKIHPGGLEQHLAAQFGPQGCIRAALCRQRQGQILLDGHPEAPMVLCAPVQDAFAVHLFDLADGIPPAQHRAHRQRTHRVAALKAPAALRAGRRALAQLGQAVGADDGHGKASFGCAFLLL